MPRISKINKFINEIKTMDKEQLLELINNWELYKKNKSKYNQKEVIIKQKKRGRPPKKIKKEIVDDDNGDDDIDEEIEENNEESDDEQNLVPIHKKRISKRKVNKFKKDKGSPGRIEPFQVIKNRPNLFLKSKFMNMHKSDTKIDKKLNKDRIPTERGIRNDLCEIECDDCGKTFTVNESLIYSDDDGYHYKCGCVSER